jgi:hypothetical protein
MNVRQMLRAAVVIRCSLAESTYPPKRQTIIAIANMEMALMAVRTG